MQRVVLGAALLSIILAPCVQAGELPGLLAHGSAAADAKNLAAFGRLVGSWDLDVAWHHDDGRVEHRPGEWHFAWILEGRAIQDVWRVPGAGPGAPPRGYGTTIRAWDPELDAWRVTWISGLSGGTIDVHRQRDRRRDRHGVAGRGGDLPLDFLGHHAGQLPLAGGGFTGSAARPGCSRRKWMRAGARLSRGSARSGGRDRRGRRGRSSSRAGRSRGASRARGRSGGTSPRRAGSGGCR